MRIALQPSQSPRALADPPPAVARPGCVLQRGWAVSGGRISFKSGEAEAAAAVPALEVINYMMSYSR